MSNEEQKNNNTTVNDSGSATDDNKTGAGSPDDLIQKKADPSVDGGEGKSGQEASSKDKTDEGKTEPKDLEVLKQENEELQQKLGTQGDELGKHRAFYSDIKPLLVQFNEKPELMELVKGVANGDVDPSLLKAVVDGKVSVSEAEVVTKAHETVKKEVGQKAYKDMSPEDIVKKVTENVMDSMRKEQEEFKQEVAETDDQRAYAKHTVDFFSAQLDYAELAPRIKKYIDEHDVYEPEVIYAAVKGEVEMEKAVKDKQKKEGEDAKNIVANAAGGASQTATVIEDKNVVDELIGGKSNPNVFSI